MVKLKKRISIAAAVLCAALSGTAGAAVISYGTEAAFNAAAGPLTVENFDGAPWAVGSMPQGTTNLGVTWTAADDLFVTDVTARSTPQSVSDLDGASDSTDRIVAVMPAGTFAVSLWLTTFGQAHGVLVELLDGSDSVLGSEIGGSTGGFGMDTFVGLVSDTAIASVRMTSTVGGVGDDFAIDDFSFGAAAATDVAEPASLALFGLALAGLGVGRRKRC